ncbi:MAG: branched-chain amino acid ABC transporter permease [Rhizobiales bacterium]|nr:branched-chain amino acid ABC transporter permease [Hyphomicrobiales bacterium]
MLYRETGVFHDSYAEDQRVFKLPLDRYAVWIVVALAFTVIPLFASNYVLTDLLTPFLIMSIAALGLNVLTGYCGQLSLGTGAFMALGGFMTYKLVTSFPTAGALVGVQLPEIGFLGFEPFDVWFVVMLIATGLITALVGLVFGLPSLKIKGLYLAVTTLAAQFFLLWLFIKVPWFTNYSPAGIAPAPPQTLFGFAVTGAASPVVNRYLFVLALTIIAALAVKNLARCSHGRSWMAIRDMDIAAEIIGISPTFAKLSAFAFSSFLIGIAGALWSFVKINSVQTDAFGILVSFQVLFMVIIGGLGTVLGSFLGAAFVVLTPILLNIGLNAMNPLFVTLGLGTISIAMIKHIEFMVFGSLIIFFLIVEPHGFARLWQIAKQKLRTWPFPY